jgi:hypothetical protein
MAKGLADATTRSWIVAIVCALIGLSLCAVAAGMPSVTAASLHAPHWLITAVGVMFLLYALHASRSLYSNRRMSLAFVAIVFLLFSLIGVWLATIGQQHMNPEGLPGATWPSRVPAAMGALTGLIFSLRFGYRAFKAPP